MNQVELFGGPATAAPSWPEWFKPSALAKSHATRVARGLHPFGAGLSNWPGATCGNCAHLRRVKYRAGTQALTVSLRSSDEGRDALVAMDALREHADQFGEAAPIAHAIAMVALYKAEGCKGIVRRLLEVA